MVNIELMDSQYFAQEDFEVQGIHIVVVQDNDSNNWFDNKDYNQVLIFYNMDYYNFDINQANNNLDYNFFKVYFPYFNIIQII